MCPLASCCCIRVQFQSPMLRGNPVKSKCKHRREVEDLVTWLEAWNHYLCTHIAFSPSMALELVKYQTFMVMFFTHHQAEQCINYDDLFRQAAAQDPTLQWDTIK